jgi:hypothetical protein
VVAELIQPIGRSENAIEAFQRRPSALVGPGVTPTVEMHVRELEVINDPPEPSHPGTVQRALVLILVPINHVKITAV